MATWKNALKGTGLIFVRAGVWLAGHPEVVQLLEQLAKTAATKGKARE